MIAYRVLIVSVLSVSAVVLLLTAGILASKARREIVALWDRRRRAVLEPRLLVLVHRKEPAKGEGGQRAAEFRTEFGSMLGRAHRRVLEEILSDHAARVEGIARERISHAFDEMGFVDEYLVGLGARRWWKRAESAEKLGLARSARARDALVRMLTDVVPEVRLRAAKALGEIRGKAAVRSLIEALAQPNRWSTLRVAEILSRMGVEAAEGVQDAYKEMSRPARLASIDILAKLRRLESLDFLRGVLKEGDPDERARAAQALGAIAHPAATNDLVHALHDPEWPVRAMAAKALGRIGSVETLMALASSLTDKEWWVRSNSAAALRAMGPRGKEALISVLQITDNYARHQAVLMLEESGVIEEYVAALDAQQESAREKAENLIRRLVKLGRIDYLEDLAREYPNPKVRTRLGELLMERA